MSFPSLKDQQPPLDPGSLDPNINIVFSICLKNKCRYLWMQICYYSMVLNISRINGYLYETIPSFATAS